MYVCFELLQTLLVQYIAKPRHHLVANVLHGALRGQMTWDFTSWFCSLSSSSSRGWQCLSLMWRGTSLTSAISHPDWALWLESLPCKQFWSPQRHAGKATHLCRETIMHFSPTMSRWLLSFMPSAVWKKEKKSLAGNGGVDSIATIQPDSILSLLSYISFFYFCRTQVIFNFRIKTAFKLLLSSFLPMLRAFICPLWRFFLLSTEWWLSPDFLLLLLASVCILTWSP